MRKLLIPFPTKDGVSNSLQVESELKGSTVPVSKTDIQEDGW